MLEAVDKACVRNGIVFTIYVTFCDERGLFCNAQSRLLDLVGNCLPYTLGWFSSVLPALPPPHPSSPSSYVYGKVQVCTCGGQSKDINYLHLSSPEILL